MSAPQATSTPPKSQIAAVIFTVFESLVVILATIATPIPQFLPKERTYTACVDTPAVGGIRCYKAQDKSCYTLWGYKEDCATTKYTSRTNTWGCKRRRNNMVAASALSICGIVLAVCLLVLGLLMVFNIFRLGLAVSVGCAVATACLIACWGCVVDVYNTKMCKNYYAEEYPAYAFKSFTNLASGFILLVIASGFQTANAVVALFIS